MMHGSPPKAAAGLAERYILTDMRAKKSLGQHFLTSPAIAREIAATAELSSKDTVLEVGPGKGMLTRALLERGARVIALEKDLRLIAPLKEIFSGPIKSGQLEILYEDALEFLPEAHGLRPGGYKLVANIPYYITGALLRKFLEGNTQPSVLVLMVQNEVAGRITARDGKESILSLSVKTYGKVKKVRKVPATVFRPVPKVDSAVIKVNAINKDFFKKFDEKSFFTLIHAAFGQKRKFLKNNLSAQFSKTDISKAFEACRISEKARAEDLPIETWQCLASELLKPGTGRSVE
ncbi:MAG: 16S rRNA (adenine(1518)-N(6)/adenine(1519)-N(6))-dimethyltransferase RsmA [bacterium]|nr:16S rRNA (adenine(1518)-N(6)/adenine(1519)-N(6))-dimethyltransferase RsmA [bacterium]